MEFLQPPDWARPKGYANGVAAKGRMVFVSGMVGWDPAGVFHTDDFAGQARQALANVVAVLAEAKALPEHIVRMTWYVTDKREYVAAYPQIGVAYRELIGRHFPAMTAVEVRAVGSSRVDLQACKLEYSIVSPK